MTEARDGVLAIILNRPEARNAINRAVAAALDRLEHDDDSLPGVLTGAGPGSGGMDSKALVRGESSFILVSAASPGSRRPAAGSC